jgi:hypothetical protein
MKTEASTGSHRQGRRTTPALAAPGAPAGDS